MIFLDACAIIYLIEAKDVLGDKTRSLVKNYLVQGNTMIVSRLSFLECRVIPLKQRNNAILQYYTHFLQSPELIVVELNKEVIEVATQLRVNHSIKTPDALQIACAIF